MFLLYNIKVSPLLVSVSSIFFLMFQANNLRSCLQEWSNIGASKTVLDWLQQGVKLPLISDPHNFELENYSFNPKEEKFVDSEIKNLQQAKAIIPVPYKPWCVSPIGCTPKRGGGFRLITDLRKFNAICKPPKFVDEGIDTVISLLEKNDYLVTADIKNGFLHIPVHKAHQTYLGIKWKNVYYVWTTLPFGLNYSPYVFNKTVRPVIQFLREKGLRIVAYVDDFCLMSQGDSIDIHKDIFIKTLLRLGWKINWEKSSLVPKQEKVYIGYVINTSAKQYPEIRIPNSRIRKLKRDIHRALQKQCIKAKVLARVLGQCVSMTKAVLPAKLLLRNAYRVLAQRDSWDSIVYFDNASRKDLVWWETAIDTWNGRVLFPSAIEAQVMTDASNTGWGGYYNGMEANGYWNKRMTKMSINYRELMAVMLTLISFKHLLKGKNIQVLSDNITTIAYLNNLGGPNAALSQLASAIWLEAHNSGITLSGRHLAGTLNTSADMLSRIQQKYEWQLHPAIFNYIDMLWGPHDVDRFATMSNTQLPIYNSFRYDPLTSGVDAFAQSDWEKMNNFCNPPFRLISRVLNKINQTGATATLIAPKWPQQQWYKRLTQMCIAPPLKITKSHGAIIPGYLQPEPMRNRQWQIFAWRICGRKN